MELLIFRQQIFKVLLMKKMKKLKEHNPLRKVKIVGLE